MSGTWTVPSDKMMFTIEPRGSFELVTGSEAITVPPGIIGDPTTVMLPTVNPCPSISATASVSFLPTMFGTVTSVAPLET